MTTFVDNNTKIHKKNYLAKGLFLNSLNFKTTP